MENSICDQFKDELKTFQEWILTQPQLPQNMKNLLLLRYLKVCDFDQERAGRLLCLNLDMRRKNPHIFFDRDIDNEKLQSILKTVQACPIPSSTKEKHKVTIFRLVDCDPSKYDVVSNVKSVFMMSDVRFIMPDSVGLTEGEIGVMDFKGFSIRHFMNIVANLTTVRTYLQYVQECVPFKIHQNHFVNCSPIVTRIMSLVRPFVKKELFDVMHFHTSGYDSLYEHVSKADLPFEYGGTAGNLDDIFEAWLKTVESHREYLNDDLNWKLSENKT